MMTAKQQNRTKVKAKPPATGLAREVRLLADLHPHGRNPRRHGNDQVQQIAASIEQWGFTVPVLVDEANVILAGHGRAMAAALLGIEEVPVVVARGWTEEQKLAYVIADNKIAANSQWDELMLGEELQALRLADFDVARLGFTDDEVKKMLGIADPPEGFNEVGEGLATEHECPRCHYKWS